MNHSALSLLEQLTAIESVNPHFTGGSRGESEVADFLEARCRANGIECRRQTVLPGRDNVIIEVRGGKPRPTLLFEAHMDTVPPGNMVEAFTPIYRDGRLYGRGACDTKGSLAAMLAALEQAAGEPASLPCDIVLCAAVDEEYQFRGVMSLLDLGLQVDGAVVGEPTDLSIVVAHKGVCRFAVTTHGKAAHSSMPHLGISAIAGMRPVLDFINDTIEPELSRQAHPLCGAATVVIGTIKGGTQINIVPDRCEIEVDRRVLPGENSRAVLRDFETRLCEVLRSRGIEFSVRELLLDEPLATPSDAAIVSCARRGAATLGLPTKAIGVPYGSDASKLQAYGGIPSIVYGPGSIGQAHSDAEFVPIDEVEQATAFYLELMRTFGKEEQS